MKVLFKSCLLIIFLTSSINILAKTNNKQLANIENSEISRSSNPINLYGAAVFLVVALCAYRFRKKII
ncbi:hypothetical protein [Empedobacter tilapiae]|uniref:LPXTG cell wall anchor domain-containing protein n=1 Tax=Empedobacter tilapiae TaxID=2491114 RepID=A0A4Z1B391_9FLAO|nr:hypothetical protein [Empedobacter tilapiae]TGN27993.1 hypothetical protein E4J94_07215 [Empedobacter tilapiae]